tara:strand:+ start:9167 stop:9883 length:717 start_codon:yes stop_codon:yes gene_type:complete
MLERFIYYFDLIFFSFSNIFKLKKTIKKKSDLLVYLIPSFLITFCISLGGFVFFAEIINKYKEIGDHFMITLSVLGLIGLIFFFVSTMISYLILFEYSSYDIPKLIKKAKAMKNKRFQISFIDYCIKEYDSYYNHFSSGLKLENISEKNSSFGLKEYREILIELEKLGYKYEENRLNYLSDKERLISIHNRKNRLIKEEEEVLKKIYKNDNKEAQEYIQSLKNIEFERLKDKTELETL